MFSVDTEIKLWLNDIKRHLYHDFKHRKHIITILNFIQSKSKNKNNPVGLKLAMSMCIDMENKNMEPISLVNKFCNALDNDDIVKTDYILTTIYEGTDIEIRHHMWNISDKIAKYVSDNSTEMVLIMEILESKLNKITY